MQDEFGFKYLIGGTRLWFANGGVGDAKLGKCMSRVRRIKVGAGTSYVGIGTLAFHLKVLAVGGWRGMVGADVKR